MERIQKILARGGIASRRAAEQLVTSGRVRVNGRIVTELGAKADPRKDRIEVDGKRVVAEPFVYVVLHKPRGVVATMSDPEGRPTVRELLGVLAARVYPVGRLDFATSGVLLATNDGGFADGLLHPRRAVPKTYVVKVKGKMEDDDLDRWRKGVRLEDGMTLPADVRLIRHEGDKTWFELTIREGRNQQIRRMGEATGFPVMRLARVGFAGITGEGLRPGQWRPLTRDELVALKKEYGVPKSLPSQEAIFALAPRKPARGPAPRRGQAARDARARGTEGPRYGGGSPGRRSYEVTEDWGGGAGRGSSGGRFERSNDREGERDAPRGDVGGGRSGRSRTTGTGGGIGARGPTDRVKSRRG
jgi:23S rRNA pseudouridine2605 synthase